MTWTDEEMLQLDGIRYRKAAVRALRAVATGICIVLAMRHGLLLGIAAWLIALALVQCLEPEIPDRLSNRAREIDRQRAARR